MKITIQKPVEIEITFVSVVLPVHYEEEDMPNDFPLRDGDTWAAVIDIDTGKIHDWPEDQTGEFNMKVCDSGIYTLGNAQDSSLAVIEDYVPHGLIPGSYDYVEFRINEQGIITNWPKKPSVARFFSEEDDD